MLLIPVNNVPGIHQEKKLLNQDLIQHPHPNTRAAFKVITDIILKITEHYLQIFIINN